jgi:Flp pilus assembly protein TadD
MADAVNRADSLVELGRYDEAVAVLHDALVADPHDVHALGLLTVALTRLDRHQEAVAAAGRLVAAAPDHAVAHRLMSVALQGAGDKRHALAAARSSVHADPLDALGQAQLALTAHAYPWHRKEARAAAARAVALDPGDDDAHFAAGYTARRRSQRRASYRRALAINPLHPSAANNLVVAQGRRWSLAKLAEGYLGVLGNEPSYATAQENLVALTFRFYFAGILLLVLAALEGGAEGTFERFSLIRVVLAVVAAGLMVAYAVGMRRAVPAGARAYLGRAWRGRPLLIVTTLHAAAMVGCGFLALLLPGGPVVGIGLGILVGWANLGLVLWGTIETRRRRRLG